MSKNVRILPAGANVPAVRKVNIVTTTPADRALWVQTTADDRSYESVQDTGGTVAGLKTVSIPGYSPGGGGGALQLGGQSLQLGGQDLTLGA